MELLRVALECVLDTRAAEVLAVRRTLRIGALAALVWDFCTGQRY